jgi:uroporphyrin-III C-methyltransferase
MSSDPHIPPPQGRAVILSTAKDPETVSITGAGRTLPPQSPVPVPATPSAPPAASTDKDAQPGHVYLVGAGPGNPDLLTLRAHQLLTSATLILADGLISPEILALANPAARTVSVAKRCGEHRITQAEIHALTIKGARNGDSVLRLKSGDPLIFGRAGEEIAALRSAHIAFEIVPGITAAFAAAASLQTPLTDRTSASKLILATAHHAANKPDLDPNPQPIWQGPLPTDATLVLYMPGPNLETLAHDLIRSGIAPATPVTAISRASTPHEHTHTTTLQHLRSANTGPAPVLLLIGDAIQPATHVPNPPALP